MIFLGVVLGWGRGSESLEVPGDRNLGREHDQPISPRNKSHSLPKPQGLLPGTHSLLLWLVLGKREKGSGTEGLWYW